MSSSTWLLFEMLSVVARTTLLLVAAEIIARALTKRAAALRHAVWAAALLAVIVVPASTLIRLPALVVVPTSVVNNHSASDVTRAVQNTDGARTSSAEAITNGSQLWDTPQPTVSAEII